MRSAERLIVEAEQEEPQWLMTCKPGQTNAASSIVRD